MPTDHHQPSLQTIIDIIIIIVVVTIIASSSPHPHHRHRNIALRILLQNTATVRGQPHYNPAYQSYCRAYPRAMVIEPLNTIIVHRAVMRPRRLIKMRRLVVAHLDGHSSYD